MSVSSGDYTRGQIGDQWIGGLYGNVYGPVSTGSSSGMSSDPFGSGWGQGGDASWSPGETPSTWGQDNGPDAFNLSDTGNPYDTSSMAYQNQMDYNSDMGGGSFGNGGFPSIDPSAQGGSSGFTQTLYDILNSKAGKIGSGLLSLVFPQVGLPLVAARTGLGMATGHAGEALGGLAGGLAQSALGITGPAAWLAGQAGLSMGAGGATLGRMYDQGQFGGSGVPGNGFTTGGNTMYPAYNTGGMGSNGSPVGGGMQAPAGYGAGGADNFASLGAGLGTMYLGNKAAQQTQGQINNLQGLYGPNSPYAQQMKQALERQDAASGRRSQYGTRAVELQARLADAASRQAPTLANLYQQRQNNEFAKYAAMYGMARNAGLFDPKTYSGLSGMFGGGSAGGYSADPYQSGWGMTGDSGWGG